MLKKVYLNKANENWILDRLRAEWYLNNSKISSRTINTAETIWICSPWTWKKLNQKKLNQKKVICSIYHIDEEKFDETDLEEFAERDKFVDFYHVISNHTKNQLSRYTSKKIVNIPFWADPKIWFDIEDMISIRRDFNIPTNSYLIGSFQRDTEGHDLISPKLSKGPDRFIEIISKLETNKPIHVLLSGKRRNFVINELEKINVPYSYFEMVDIQTLNRLYNSLDLYIVTSRVEGGPQAIVECAMSKTPIISTDVGVAPEILSPKSIFDMENFQNAVPDVNFAYEKSKQFHIPTGFEKFKEMINY